MDDRKIAKKQRIQSLLYAAFIALVLSFVVTSVWVREKQFEKISFREHLDDTAVTIDGTDYPLRDFAIYLAYREQETQEQARTYDRKQTGKYWNLHINGSFIKVVARDAAMNQAIHDMLFYQMALELEGEVKLTEEETAYMENQKADFWNDLEEEGQERLGVSKAEVEEAFYRMALAQKAQQIYADKEGVDNREYAEDGELYQKLLEKHSCKVNKKLWKRLNFGKITIE